MTPDEISLARFQATLLERLDADLSPEEVREQLLSSPELAPFRNYIGSFEPRQIDVALSLVKQWGRRRSTRDD